MINPELTIDETPAEHSESDCLANGEDPGTGEQRNKLSQVALSGCLESAESAKDNETRSKINLLKRKYGLINLRDKSQDRSPLARLDLSQVDMESNLNLTEQVGECAFGYYIAAEMLKDLTENNGRSFLTKNQSNFLVEVNETNPDGSDNVYYLAQIYNTFKDKMNKYQRANNGSHLRTVNSSIGMNQDDYENVKHCLKTNYIIKLNNMIKEYMDIAGPENNSVGFVFRKLKNAFGYITSSNSSIAADIEGLDNINVLNGNLGELEEKVFGAIEGMRHENGFLGLIAGLQDDEEKRGMRRHSIDVFMTDDQADSRGIDMILAARVVKLGDNGAYRFATDEELEKGSYVVRRLPVDIKSTKTKAESELEKQRSMQSNPSRYPDFQRDHYVMWSQLSSRMETQEDNFGKKGYERDDFRQKIRRENGKTYLDYYSGEGGNNESPIYLNGDHLSLMKLFENKELKRRFNYQLDPFSVRIDRIKRDILKGIKEMESVSKDITRFKKANKPTG